VKGDSFTTADSDADTFKWDAPASTCTVGTPTTITRAISEGVLHLGSDKQKAKTRVGVVGSATVSGDLDVRVTLHEVSTQNSSHIWFQLLNEPRCDWGLSPRTADGVFYEWNEGVMDNQFTLRAVKVLNGTGTSCGGSTTLTGDPVQLRIARAGNLWKWSYSFDGSTWLLDRQCTFAGVAGGLYPSLLATDEKSGPPTKFDLDDFTIVSEAVGVGGFRTAGDWTSPPFDIPSGKVLDQVAITGSFTPTWALDRTEIRKSGTVLASFDQDNLLTVTPSLTVCGSGIDIRLFLKGDGTGTPIVTQVDAILRGATAAQTIETVATGTSTGTVNQCGSDDLRETKTETIGGIESTQASDGETDVVGIPLDGTHGDTSSSDDVNIHYREQTDTTHNDTPPDSEILTAATHDSGSFPACLESSDGSNCTYSESATSSEQSFYPGTETIALGSRTQGRFPDDIMLSDDDLVQYSEQDGSTSTADYTASSQSVLIGSEDLGAVYRQGTFARKTDGPGPQTVAGVGFQGRALILWWTRQIAFGTAAGDSAGVGLVASTSQQYSVSWAADNGITPSNTGRHSAASAIVILGSGTPTLDGEAVFTGFTADGFTLGWTTNPNPAPATIIHFVVLGSFVSNAYLGQFVGPAAGVTGNRAYTGVGFRGNAAIFLTSLQTSLGDATSATMGFGVATGSSNRASGSIAIPDDTSTALTESVQDLKALVVENPAASPNPATDQSMDFVSFDADGFTLNHVKATTGNVLFWALVLQGGNYKVNYLTRPTVTGDQVVTGVGFQPKGVLFFGEASSLAFGAEDSGAEFILGGGTQATGSTVQGVMWGGENNANNPANAHMHTSNSRVIVDLSLTSQSSQNLASYKSSDADGFTITWSTVQTGSGQKWPWLAIGGSGQGSPFPACAQGSDDVECAYREASVGGIYEVEVKYSWTGVGTLGTEWRLYAEGREGATNPETIDIRIYGSDETTLSPAVCTLSTVADALYDCGPLTVDQLDGGTPDILFQDTSRSSDASQSSFLVDRAYVHETIVTKVLSVRYDWSGISLGGSSYELRLEAQRDDENILVQVLTPPSTWTTRLTISSTTDVVQTYVLSDDELNGGSPSVRFVDADPSDVFASSFRIDQVRIVRLDSTYSMNLEWDWTNSVTPTAATTLELVASRGGDSETIEVDVWDWQDLGWRAAFGIDSPTPFAYSTPLATACTVAPSDCEVSGPAPGSVRIRFVDVAGADLSKTSLNVDLGVVRATDLSYQMDIVYSWSSIGVRSAEDILQVEGHVSDETVNVQVWDWVSSSWTTPFTIDSTTDVTHEHLLLDREISSGLGVQIRFVGTNDGGGDTVPSDLWLDYVAIERHEYRLDVQENLTGITVTGSVSLRLEGRLTSAGENFDVYVWDYSAGAWTLWLDSSFTTSDQVFVHAVQASEIRSGSVLVRFVDDNSPGDLVASQLEIDLLEAIPAT